MKKTESDFDACCNDADVIGNNDGSGTNESFSWSLDTVCVNGQYLVQEYAADPGDATRQL